MKKLACWSIGGIALGWLYFGLFGLFLGLGEVPRLGRTSLDYGGILFGAFLLGVLKPGFSGFISDLFVPEPRRADRFSVLLMVFSMLLVGSLFVSGAHECDRQGCGYYFSGYLPSLILTFSSFSVGVAIRLSVLHFCRFKEFLRNRT